MTTLGVVLQGGRFLLESKLEMMVAWTWLITVKLERLARFDVRFRGMSDRIYEYIGYEI